MNEIERKMDVLHRFLCSLDDDELVVFRVRQIAHQFRQEFEQGATNKDDPQVKP